MVRDDRASHLKAVKHAIATKTTVYYQGAAYKPTACILRYIGGEWLYSVELTDVKAKSSRIIVKIKKVEIERTNK